MKLLVALLLLSSVAYGQSTYYIRADSIRFQKTGGSTTFILENATRAKTGAYLRNYWNGRTDFGYAVDSGSLSGSNLTLWRGAGTQNITLALPGGGGTINSDTISYYTRNATVVRRVIRDRLNELNFSIVDFGAVSGGSASTNRAAIQACVDAAEVAGGNVFIPIGTYSIDATIRIEANNVRVVGQGEGSKILATGDFGHIFHAEPTVAGSIGSFTGIGFFDFYIESATTRTSGSAIFTKYTTGAIVSKMRIGTLQYNGLTAVPIYNGISFELEAFPLINASIISARHCGVYYTGEGGGTLNALDFWGMITGNTMIMGDKNGGAYTTGSYGVHIAGGTGGVQIEQSNISLYENGIRVDKSANSIINRELFLGHAFAADDDGGAGIFIDNESLNILQITGGWAAGNGRGAQTPDDAIYISDTNPQLSVLITGGTFYANDGSGIYLGDGALTLTGANIFDNGGTDIVLGTNVDGASLVGNRFEDFTNSSSIIPTMYANQGGHTNIGAKTVVNNSTLDGANLMVSESTRTLGGTAQTSTVKFLGVATPNDNLLHMDNNSATGRGSMVLSNSATSSDWANNFMGFHSHGASYASNFYLTNISGKTSDAGYSTILSQGSGVNAMAIFVYENKPLYLGTNNSARLSISNSGAIQLNAYGAGILKTDGSGNVTANSEVSMFATYMGTGTYTPTLTNTANLDASTAHVMQYSWVKDPTSDLVVVTVSGYVDVDPTTTLTDTQLSITVPINTNFTNAQEAGGTGNSTTIAAQSAGIKANTSGNTVIMQWRTTDVTNQPMFLTFTYKVTPP